MSKSTATKRKKSSHRLDPIVAKAVREAQKAAPGDDREFFNRLKEKLGPKVLPPPKRGGGALSTGRSAGPQAAGARVRDDPRYVANLRALARRSANARIIGGTAVTGADLRGLRRGRQRHGVGLYRHPHRAQCRADRRTLRDRSTPACSSEAT